MLVHITVADIGVWEHVQQQRHAFFGKMQVRREHPLIYEQFIS